MRSNPLAIALATAFLLSAAACSPSGDDQAAGIVSPAAESFLVGDRNDNFRVRLGIVNVCAFFGEDLGPSASFSASAPSGENVISGAFDIRYPDCIEVWNATTSSTVAVGASLLSNTAGWQLDRIVTAVGNLVDESTLVTHTGVTSASVNVSNAVGGFIWFKFVPREVPPPGGEGCTPGYWKQSQHFGNWTAPYTPTTAFSSVFANAFPGMNLLQVLSQGGGGMKALGRHAVAALLNTASANVDYDLTTAQVIAAFNSAYASGNAGTIEQQKNLFDILNNQGCPLARAP